LPRFNPVRRRLAVVGIAAFFCAVVRAPLTGIILAIELTGSFTLLLPMLAACFAAMLVPTLMGNPPIYETRDRIQRLSKSRFQDVVPITKRA
jgi:CIC family chloride channel protein